MLRRRDSSLLSGIPGASTRGYGAGTRRSGVERVNSRVLRHGEPSAEESAEHREVRVRPSGWALARWHRSWLRILPLWVWSWPLGYRLMAAALVADIGVSAFGPTGATLFSVAAAIFVAFGLMFLHQARTLTHADLWVYRSDRNVEGDWTLFTVVGRLPLRLATKLHAGAGVMLVGCGVACGVGSLLLVAGVLH